MMRMYFELDKADILEEKNEEKNEEDPFWIFEDDEIDEIEIQFNPYK